MDNHLIIADHKSSNQLIHIFNMQDFTYVQSIGELGQGPGEITILGNIGIDNIRKNLYISDYGKQKYSVTMWIVRLLILSICQT